MNKLNVGDVVRLKSGGPWMTVTSVDGDFVNCTWLHGDSFDCGSLSLHADCFVRIPSDEAAGESK